MTLQNRLSRWRLRRIIAALSYATDYGLKKEVKEFAESLEATSMMLRGSSMKKDTPVIINCTREQLDSFITYMTRLHNSKLSLWHRARIGLATLVFSDRYVLGESPEDFIRREFPLAKSAKKKRIIIVNRQ